MPHARGRKGRFDTGMTTANHDYIVSIITTMSRQVFGHCLSIPGQALIQMPQM
jgi:hypothetical protein